jgi:hypothetical protein
MQGLARFLVIQQGVKAKDRAGHDRERPKKPHAFVQHAGKSDEIATSFTFRYVVYIVLP